jgi:crossover junction endodeoxyribonuclease RusA
VIELPFPPAILSGHNTGHWREKASIVAKHRDWAKKATWAAGIRVPETGDIRLIVTFYPQNKRGDRVNYPTRCKPYFDGIADALQTNDSRFVPTYHFAEPVRQGKVVIVVEAGEMALAA